MRRGLLGWSESEVPLAALKARLGRCKEAMRDAGLDGLLVYTNFPRPAAVSYLTHFIPYWNQGVLLVRKSGSPTLFISLSKRMQGWMEETSNLDDIVCTPRLGKSIAEAVAETLPGAERLGVLELSKFPGGVAAPIVQALPAVKLEDATALFARIRHPADEPEIALSRRAMEIARDGLEEAVAGKPDRAGALLGAIEGPARVAGAEELQVLVAPDLAADPRLQRPEEDVPLGDRYAVQVSCAYKGHWVRLARTVANDDGEAGAALEARLTDDLAGGLDLANAGASLSRAVQGLDGAALKSWRVEVCTGSAPLSTIQDEERIRAPVPRGSIISFTALVDTRDGPLMVGAPFLVSADEDGTVSALPL